MSHHSFLVLSFIFSKSVFDVNKTGHFEEPIWLAMQVTLMKLAADSSFPSEYSHINLYLESSSV